jgi:hypothetical protein
MSKANKDVKQQIRERISYSIDRYSMLDGTLDKIKGYISDTEYQIRKLFPQYHTIEFDHSIYEDYGSVTCDIDVYGTREETDEEFSNRLTATKNRSIAAKKAAERSKKLKEEADYQTYLKLQEKYKDIK